MPRPVRCRRIGMLPVYRSFSPDETRAAENVSMTVDEFESIRLLDNEDLTQEECAEKMNISRTTVTAIYDSARKKVADALVNGKRLLITGGCWESGPVKIIQKIMNKGEKTMRIAVAFENGEVFQHFGHTSQFRLYDIENGKITGEQTVDTEGSGHGALAGFLKAAGVDALICGGIGMGARMALEEAGIKLHAGVEGSADEAAKALAEGTLSATDDATCDHHGHGEDHECAHGHEKGHCGHHAHGGEHCGEHHGKDSCKENCHKNKDSE